MAQGITSIVNIILSIILPVNIVSWWYMMYATRDRRKEWGWKVMMISITGVTVASIVFIYLIWTLVPLRL